MLKFDKTTSGTEGTFSLEQFLGVLRRRFWAVLLTVLIMVGAATGFSLIQTPIYEASISVLVGQEASDESARNLSNDVQGLQQLTATMAEAVTTLPVAQAAAEELNLPAGSAEQLLGNLSAQADPNTMFIQISYQDPDPERAQRVANAVGDVFSEQVSKVSPNASSITATVWEPAVLPENPVSPEVPRNVGVALVIGLVLGVALAFLLERFDETWDSPEEVERVSGVPTFGTIPRFEVLSTVKEKGES